VDENSNISIDSNNSNNNNMKNDDNDNLKNEMMEDWPTFSNDKKKNLQNLFIRNHRRLSQHQQPRVEFLLTNGSRKHALSSVGDLKRKWYLRTFRVRLDWRTAQLHFLSNHRV